MNWKQLFAVPHQPLPAALALLLLRVVSGVAFMFHGWSKIQDPFVWMGPESAIPGFLQALAALSEFGGGLAWIIGLLTPLASFGLFCTMVVAFLFHAAVRGDPFVAMGPGLPSSELAAVYLAISLILLTIGPGRISLDKKFFGSR